MTTAAKTEAAPQSTEIMFVGDETPQIVLLNPEKFDQFYERVKAQTESLVVDLTTKKGRDEIRSMASKVTKSKTAIDKARLELTSQWREQTNQVNAAGKEITVRLDTLADETRRPLTEWEEAEKARVAFCQTVIADLKRGAVVTMDDTADEVRARGSAAYNIVLTEETFGDMLFEAQAVKDQVVATLKAALDRLVKEEADKAELEKLRAEAAERERVEAERAAAAEVERIAAETKAREEEEARAAEERRAAAEQAEAERIERAAKEAEERAKAQAEAAANEAAAQRQREHDEALAAERRRAEEAEAAAQAERERAAKEESDRKAALAAEAAEQAKRDKNRAHRAQIMGEAKIAIMAASDIDDAAAVLIVKAIVAAAIPHVTLRF